MRVSYLARRHHHTTTDGVQGVRADTGTGGDGPAEQEGGQEVALERADEKDRLDGVVHSKVETAVDDNSGHGRTESTVQAHDAVRRKRLAVDVDKTIELARTAGLGVFGVVGKTRTGVVERVDKQQRGGTSSL